jgi:hypothetical protein
MNAANAVIDPLTAPSPDGANDRPRLGRPLLMTPAQVLERIASLSREGNLFRVHHVEPGLYARARRQFGSWAAAVNAAGLDYSEALETARRRSLQTRRQRPPAKD